MGALIASWHYGPMPHRQPNELARDKGISMTTV